MKNHALAISHFHEKDDYPYSYKLRRTDFSLKPFKGLREFSRRNREQIYDIEALHEVPLKKALLTLYSIFLLSAYTTTAALGAYGAWKGLELLLHQ